MHFLKHFTRLSVAVFLALGLMAPASASAAELVVIVTGINPDKGLVRLGLYKDAESFPKNGRTIADGKAIVRNGEVRYVFRNLDAGRYAVALFHDANSNGRFDKSVLGLPREGFAFSNGARAVLAPPSFERAAVTVRGHTTIRISITY